MLSPPQSQCRSRGGAIGHRVTPVLLVIIAALGWLACQDASIASAAEPPAAQPTNAVESSTEENAQDSDAASSRRGQGQRGQGQQRQGQLRGALRHYQPHSFSRDGQELLYRWMQPQGFDSSGSERYPLVIFLHGAGERGSDNQSQLKHGAAELSSDARREKFPAFALFPQCPKEFQWVETDWSIAKGEGTFPNEPSRPLSLTLELVDHLLAGKRHNSRIDHDRVYITGLSMGGYGTWHATALRPDLFAASAPVCGGGDPRLVDQYNRTLPIWAFHGDADTVVPYQRGREIVDALNSAGQKPEAKFTVYPGVKHNSWTPTYAKEELYDWMFEQRRSKNDDQIGERSDDHESSATKNPAGTR